MRQSRDALDDLRSLAPWLELPEVPAGQREIADFDRIPTLREMAGDAAVRLADIETRLGQEIAREEMDWLIEYRVAIAAAAERARTRIAACERLAQEATGFATANQEFLYDRTRHLLAIGYNVDERRRDTSFYDLLASEARLAHLRCDRAGPASAGKLVRPREVVDDRGRRPGARFMERLDVRVPDAAPGDARL